MALAVLNRSILLCSETHNLKKESIKQQYEVVKARTAPPNDSNIGSHVMEYGNKTFKDDKLFLYQGFYPVKSSITNRPLLSPSLKGAINQRDADILFMWKKVKFQLFQLKLVFLVNFCGPCFVFPNLSANQ